MQIQTGAITTGVVARLNGKYWGQQFADGHSTHYDFGPLDSAHISNPKFCTKPEDMTYTDSPYIEQLRRAELVHIIKTTQYVIY